MTTTQPKVILGKKEIVQKILEKLSDTMTKAQITQVMDSFLSVMEESLTRGHKIKINSYFSAIVKINEARSINNPHNDDRDGDGENRYIKVPQRASIKIKPGSNFKGAAETYYKTYYAPLLAPAKTSTNRASNNKNTK